MKIEIQHSKTCEMQQKNLQEGILWWQMPTLKKKENSQTTKPYTSRNWKQELAQS